MNYAPQGFKKYVDECATDLAFVEDLLGAVLSDNPEQLVGQLREVEAWFARVTKVCSDANAYLDVGEQHGLPPKGSGTDLDRQTAQAAAVAEQRAFRNRLDGLARAINTRLMLGMSLLKHHESERRGLGASVGS